MAKRKQPTRPWSLDDLLDIGRREGESANYLKAVPILFLEKWVSEGREDGSANYVWTKQLARRLENCNIVSAPFKPKGTGNIIGGLSTIQKSRNLNPALLEYQGKGMTWVNLPHYEPLLQEYRELYRDHYSEDYAKLFRDGEPDWGLQEAPERPSRQLQPESLKIFQLLQQYEVAWEQELQEAQNRADAAEQENRELLDKLSQSDTPLREITDEVLKKRISTMLRSPLDTMIREAGVILEDRLRSIGGAGYELEGVRLVDTLLSPENGRLIFSSHRGEQEGVRMLYRGAMQFIRNPPMHKLIEYPEDTALLLIRLVDSLLQLLSEAELRR